MKIAVGIISYLFFTSAAFAACQVTDDAGHTLQLTHPAKRTISLAPDLTEIVFAVGAKDHLVGVVAGSDYPSLAKKIPVVATYNSLNAEKIAMLQPDLIIAWTETNYTGQLDRLGVPVYLSHPHKLADVAVTMKKVGCMAGTSDIATQASNLYLTRYHALKNKYARQKPRKVFYQLWSQPLMTVTEQSWINEAMTLCGGQNIFAHLPGTAPEVSVEAVVLANPDVIIASKNDNITQWASWSQMSAVSQKQIIQINPDLLDRAGPRLLAGVAILCQAMNK